MITRILLKNYRSHQNTDLVIDEPILLILGENNSGKSSILDAISSTCLGDPWEEVRPVDKATGKPIDCDETLVRLEWEDGRTIERTYDGKTYTVTLTTDTGTTQGPYTKLSDIKDLTREFTGVKPLEAKNEQIYPQLMDLDDPPFLMKKTTPGAFSNRMNALLPGAVLQTVESKLQTESSQAKTALNKAEAEFERVEKLLDELSLEEMNLDFIEHTTNEASDLLDANKVRQEEIEKLRHMVGEHTDKLEQLDEMFDSLDSINLTGIMDSLHLINKVVSKLKEAKLWDRGSVEILLKDANEIVRGRSGLDLELQDTRSSISLLNRCQKNLTELDNTKDELTQLENQIDSYEVCGECGRPYGEGNHKDTNGGCQVGV